jgi:hypothetical protein
MATFNELRSFVLALPDTTEGNHVRLRPAFLVSGKPFIGMEKDQAHVLMRLNPEAVQSLVHLMRVRGSQLTNAMRKDGDRN